MRIRSAGAYLALVAGMSMALAGCGQLNQVRAMKAFKDGNKLYASNDFRGATVKYEEAVQADPAGELNSCGTSPGCVYFFLANSYDNLYRPARKGEPNNDALLTKAVDNYKLASEKISDPMMKTRSLEYLVAAYGPDKLNDPTMAEPIIKADDPPRPRTSRPTTSCWPASTRTPVSTRWPSRRCSRPRSPSRTTRPSTCSSPASTTARATSRRRSSTSTSASRSSRTTPRPTTRWPPTTGTRRTATSASPTRKRSSSSRTASGAVDKAIAIKSDYMEAIAYKNLLLRLQANLEKDPKKQQALLKEADQLRDQADRAAQAEDRRHRLAAVQAGHRRFCRSTKTGRFANREAACFLVCRAPRNLSRFRHALRNNRGDNFAPC